MKKIAREITESESKKYGIDINVRPVAFADIVKPDFFTNRSYTLDKRIGDFYNHSHFMGYINYFEKGTIVVFVDKVLNKFEAQRIGSIFMLARTCYHEARHWVQQTFDRYSYDRFLSDMEMFYMKTDANRDYLENHDEYSFEIGANLYGTKMAREYLKKNYPKTYEREKRVIDAIEDRYKNDYMLYNPSYTIDRVIPRIRMLNPFGDNEIIKHDFIKDTSPVLSIFLNGDGSFKRPSEVLANEKYQSLDKRIVYAFFSSELFLKELGNIKDLTPEEVLILNNSMDYMKLLCEVQMRYYDNEIRAMDEPSNFFERQKMRLIYMRSFFSKYEYVKKYLDSLKENKEIINGKSK